MTIVRYVKIDKKPIRGLWCDDKQGQVFKISDDVIDQPGVWEVLDYTCQNYPKVYLTRDLFIESTKEEYDAQFKFILPEKWWVKATTKEEDLVLTEYCNKKFNTKTGGVNDEPSQPIFYYSEKIEKICWTVGVNRVDESFTEITYDQFIKYVLNQQPITEDHSQLIKLLNDAL